MAVVNQVSVGLSVAGDATSALFGICFSIVRLVASVTFRLVAGVVEIFETVVSSVEDAVFTAIDVAEKQVDELIIDVFDKSRKK